MAAYAGLTFEVYAKNESAYKNKNCMSLEEHKTQMSQFLNLRLAVTPPFWGN